MWLAKEAMKNPGLYCVWIAPTYRKAKIGFRYIKAMLPDCEWIKTKEGKLEIHLANGSFIAFLHGKDAEVTIEGEAVDRFVIDESGKIVEQVWHSLLTTITQTGGKGIITGTPRGHTWYRQLFKKAMTGKDPMLMGLNIPTSKSPFVKAKAIEQAKRILPKYLFMQYFEAQFVSQSTVFGDLDHMWDQTLVAPNGEIFSFANDAKKQIRSNKVKYWFHPDKNTRKGTIIHGVDLAKKQDKTVFYSTNMKGQLTGYVRFDQIPYNVSAMRLKKYVEQFFSECENIIRYDATGVGEAVGEDILEEFEDTDLDVVIEPVVFTNKSKNIMVTDTILAIEDGFHKAPPIEEIKDEFVSYELEVTKHGNVTFSAPDGEHDDIVSAAIMSVGYAHVQYKTNQGEQALADAVGIKQDEIDTDLLAAYADVITNEKEHDDFFGTEANEEDFDFDEETA